MSNKQKEKKMRAIEYKTAQGELKAAFIVSRIDENLFSCKSSSRKRNPDLLIHADYILTDVSDVKAEGVEICEGSAYANTDEFAGLCQAAEIGENPFKCTILTA